VFVSASPDDNIPAALVAVFNHPADLLCTGFLMDPEALDLGDSLINRDKTSSSEDEMRKDEMRTR
jgi:hypothetical protein